MLIRPRDGTYLTTAARVYCPVSDGERARGASSDTRPVTSSSGPPPCGVQTHRDDFANQSRSFVRILPKHYRMPSKRLSRRGEPGQLQGPRFTIIGGLLTRASQSLAPPSETSCRRGESGLPRTHRATTRARRSAWSHTGYVGGNGQLRDLLTRAPPWCRSLPSRDRGRRGLFVGPRGAARNQRALQSGHNRSRERLGNADSGQKLEVLQGAEPSFRKCRAECAMAAAQPRRLLTPRLEPGRLFRRCAREGPAKDAPIARSPRRSAAGPTRTTPHPSSRSNPAVGTRSRPWAQAHLHRLRVIDRGAVPVQTREHRGRNISENRRSNSADPSWTNNPG